MYGNCPVRAIGTVSAALVESMDPQLERGDVSLTLLEECKRKLAPEIVLENVVQIYVEVATHEWCTVLRSMQGAGSFLS